MNRMIFLMIFGFFLVSCGMKNPFGTPEAENNNPFDDFGKEPITINIQVDWTPVPTPQSIRLSPINADNVIKIQPLFTDHVNRETPGEELLIISPDKTKFALAPKDSAPMKVLGLNWAPDGSFFPILGGSSTDLLFQTASITFSPDSKYLATANKRDNSVAILDLTGFPLGTTRTVLPVGNAPEAVTFTKDSQKLIIGTQTGAWGSQELWDVKTASLQREILQNVPGGICSAAISPDGKVLATGYCTKIFDISTWDVDNDYAPLSQIATLEEVAPCANPPCHGKRNIFVFNPMTGLIATSADFPRITSWDPQIGRDGATVSTGPAGEPSIGGDAVSSMIFTTDGALLVMAANQLVQIFDAQDGKLLWYYGDPKGIKAATISADSSLMITINSEGDLIFWGVPTK